MYINELNYRNIGPIDQLTLTFRRNENGVPVPAVFVGKNGSGKSILLSNIVDAFYEIANAEYHNVTPTDGRGHPYYYKKIAREQIKLGQPYMTAYIRLEHHENKYEYVFKSGKIAFEEFEKMMKTAPDKALDWKEEENYKKFTGNQKAISKLFESGIICFFRPDRYAKPSWMGDEYDVSDEQVEYSAETKYTHQLDNPITASNDPKETLQWLFDVIADSRADLEKENDGGHHIVYPKTSVLDLLSISRANAEKLMSTILGEDVIFRMGNRSSRGRRFRICRRDGTELVPSLDALSTGQLALFNLFATVIRYADNDNIDLSHRLGEIEGVVVIDEIELHLHAELQRKVLPKLIALFPKVQFIMTSHSPLFLLGMREEFGEDSFDIYEMPLGRKISVEQFSEFENAYQYLAETNRHQAEIVREIEKRQGRPLIITEGATDWKHMKAARQALLTDLRCSDWLPGLQFDFLEYMPVGSGGGNFVELEMGDSQLLDMCEQHQRIFQSRKLIFIADRDVSKVVKKMADEAGNYKVWGNHVYSLCIPVPKHRAGTPNICIEHLYLDDQIKRELEDGTKRRVFMGNEFDSDGIFLDGGEYFCKNINCCGPDKIDIIDGSDKKKVRRVKGDPQKNYALSKMNFADYVLEKEKPFDHMDFSGFIPLFKTICDILSAGE